MTTVRINEKLGKSEEKTEEVFASKAQIEKAIADMAKKIEQDMQGERAVIVAIQSGGALLGARLAELLDYEISYIQSTLYDKSNKNGGVCIGSSPESNLAGRKVLVIGGVMDSVGVIGGAVNFCSTQKPKDVRVAVLVDQPEARAQIDKAFKMDPDYYCFRTSPRKMSGFGLTLSSSRCEIQQEIPQLKEELGNPAQAPQMR